MQRLARSLCVLTIGALPAVAQNQFWIRQLGTSEDDSIHGAAADNSGGVYLFGSTSGNLGGPNAEPSGDTTDAWLARYDSAGGQLWIRQLGTTGDDFAYAVAPDGSGGAFVCGHTDGSLGGQNASGYDVWFAHYDNAGNQSWLRQVGTSATDYAFAAAPDGSGGVYIGGHTNGSLGGPVVGNYDAWLARYDSVGNQIWTRQFGTGTDEYIFAVAADGLGGVYVSGQTQGILGGTNAGSSDAWLARFDSAGSQLWIRQFGTSTNEYPYTAAPDGSGGVYIGGHTNGSLGGPVVGNYDAWLARWDSEGNQVWIRQLGTTGDDVAYVVVPDGSGGLLVSGYTDGSLGGPNAGGGVEDAWFARYDGTGSQLWIRQVGTSGPDIARAAAPDGWGGLYVGGQTHGSLGGQLVGGVDAWFAHYDSGCLTQTTYCTAGTTVHGCVPSISGVGAPSSQASSGFDIVVSNVEGQRYGLIYYGFAQVAVPWSPASSSYRCVSFPQQRTPVVDSGGTAGQCNGELRIDFNAWRAANPGGLGNPFVAGQVFYAQGWFRDPGAPKQTNLSDGLRFVLCD